MATLGNAIILFPHLISWPRQESGEEDGEIGREERRYGKNIGDGGERRGVGGEGGGDGPHLCHCTPGDLQ